MNSPEGDEDLFAGLISAWNDSNTDPAADEVEKAEKSRQGTWRLDRIEAAGFGGLTVFGGPTFDLRVNGENWCLEGQNGSGKTSLASVTLWALTGKRIREHDGPIDERGERSPVVNTAGKKIGDWPSFASYPPSAADLIKPVEVWARLTFTNAQREFATAYRQMVSPLAGNPTSRVNVDPRLLAAPELIETGLLMPARLARIGFGERSKSLYDAVKILTGLDQLADISDGCGQLTHGGRRFLRFGKDNDIDGLQVRFTENMASAELKAKEVNFALPAQRILAEDTAQSLRKSAELSSAEAGGHLRTLKSEIAREIDTTTTEGRRTISNAVSTARVLSSQGTKGIAVFEAWTALKEASEHPSFTCLPARIETGHARILCVLSPGMNVNLLIRNSV